LKTSILRELPIDNSLAIILGYYIGEGSKRNKQSFGFSFNTSETDKAEFVETYFSKYGISCSREIRGKSLSVRANSSLWQTLLEVLCGKGSHNKRIPLPLPSNVIPSFLNALWFTDGHYDRKRDKYVYSTTSRRLALELYNLLREYGIIPSLQKVKNDRGFSVVNGSIYRLTVEQNASIAILKQLLSNGTPIILEPAKSPVEVISVEASQYDGMVYNLEVADDNSYTCDGFIVHNCNDGSQLDGFKKLQTKHPVKTYGVDPAENLVPLAQAKGHNVLCKYWNKDTATVLPEKMDIIIAQNVFAHVHDALGFLEACKAAMHDASTLFIQTSQANIFRNGEFDTMYHEHLSFFTIKSMRTLCERAKLNLVRVEKTDIHGTSYVFIITKTGYHSPFAPYNVREMELEETGAWMYDIETYDKFAERALDCVTRLREYVEYYKRNGILVVGYGAAAKGMTVLNYGKIELDWIIDDTPIKQGLYTPGMNTRIYSAESLLHGEEMVFIPLAWNFYTEIRERVKAVRPNTKDIFIRYFPTFEIEME
jgi:hypothetical protein